ncbi:anti-sigma factor domain-containing protein [Ectobacillus antri]|uniref:Anti-sigma factor domain-containing protein n=1 Tax=Ectobacillus antri TaxID=2486280 RepID=A0ABT6H1V3_9BACI|nr:anti-sigma factor domain-containing protein [Ectobacillus antri]MDG4655633.1 anti-sigma factor domain-containing protein [Ectobacillus antri]MDG5753391.1 anti-sigma factor domain-containing protein [Ectobacillus antri]
MNKGIIMEMKRSTVVVLTPSGEFITCKREQAYTIGQEVSIRPVQRWSFSILKPAVAILCCVFLMMLYSNRPDRVLAYVAIDINPSLEVGVTDQLRVVELYAYNKDGKRIIQHLSNWKHQSLQNVINNIVAESREEGYLKEQGITFTAVTKEKEMSDRLNQNLKDLKATYEAQSVQVVYQQSTLEQRAIAKKQGISTGKYLQKQNKQFKQPKQQEDRNQQDIIHSNESQITVPPQDAPPAMPVVPKQKQKQEQEQKQKQKQKQKHPVNQSRSNEDKHKFEQKKERVQPQHKPEQGNRSNHGKQPEHKEKPEKKWEKEPR